VLRVKSAGRMELDASSYTEGLSVGSTVIDFKVRKLVEERLNFIHRSTNGDLDNAAERMMRVSFSSYKCDFGADGYDVPKFPMPIPRPQPGLDVPEAGIKDSKMVLTRCVGLNLMYERTSLLTTFQS
jgi:hypothetical protein